VVQQTPVRMANQVRQKTMLSNCRISRLILLFSHPGLAFTIELPSHEYCDHGGRSWGLKLEEEEVYHIKILYA